MEVLLDNNWKGVFPSLLLAAVVYLGVIYYYRRAFDYWKKRNVPSVKPKIFYGNMPTLIYGMEQIGWLVKEQYNQLKAMGHKHGGFYFFTIPHYIPIDPQVIKCIMQQDFHHFTERGLYFNEKDDPISASMVTFGGERWRSLRARLSPAFTPGKIKRTFDIVVECGYQMQRALESLESTRAVDILDITICYTTDVIGSCAFGLQCNSFAELDSDIIKYAKRAMGFSLVRFFKLGLSFVCPNLMLQLGIRTFDQEAAKFFQNVVAQTVQFRKANNIVRNDLLQQLIDLQDECGSAEKDTQTGMTLKEVTANVFSFFVAGYETASVALAFCLYELSANSHVQDKLRDEINLVLEKYDGKLAYEALAEMKYMGQVIDETLRKYPPFAVVTRQCSKEYHIPGTRSVLEKGTFVMVPVVGLHHDPEYYPEPERFDPERFSEENKQHIQPFTYLPFGEGPRICIGARLAVMEIKIGLTILLQRNKFSLNRKTVLPVKIDPLNLITTPKTSIWLDIEKLTEFGTVNNNISKTC